MKILGEPLESRWRWAPVVASALLAGLAAGVLAAAAPARATNGAPEAAEMQTLVPLVPGQRVELVEERSRFSRTFDNGDGTRTLELSTTPLNYKDTAGKWQPVDTRVRADTSVHPFAFSTLANEFQTRLPQDARQPWRLERGDRWVSFRPLNAAASPATVSGDSVTYREVWPYADLRYTVTAVGVKEDIILASAEAPTEYVFLVETRGVRVQKDLDGSIGFYDLGTGRRIWMIPTCYALDTRSAGETPVTIPAAMPLRMELRKGDSGVQLHIFLDPLWLQDTARVFPVTVDPTIFQDNPALETNEWNTSAEARFTPNYDQEVTCRWDLGMPWGMWGIRPSECAVYDTRNNNRVMYRKRVEYWDSGVDYFRAQGNVTYRAWAQCGITGTIWGQYYGHAKLYITYRKNSTPVASPTVPSNGYFSRQSTVQFGWAYTDGDGDPQRGFTWQLARDSGFGQIEHTEESRTASATFGYKLPAEGTWFWRVRASDGIFWSDWTPGRRLIADWSPPQATGSPVAQPDPEDPGKKLAVSWKAWQDGASGVKEYILQWALPGQDFTDQRQEALAGTSYSVGGWGYDQKVRFRMKASDYAGNVSEWTSEFTGVTAAENSTILSASPGWDTADGHFVDIHLKKVTASGYRVKRVEVAGDSPGEPAPVVESDWFTETIYRDKAWGPEKPGLKPHGRYNYYVQTKNQEGRPTDWIAYADKDGKVVAVQVKNMPPAPPTLVFPANESTVNTKRLQCIIPGDPDGDAVQVRFEVTNVKDSNGLPDFTPTQLVFDSGWTSQADIAADALTGLKDGTYYWRVRARDDLKGDLANQSLEADLGGAYSTFTLDTTGMAGSFEITPAGATARRQVTLTNVVASSSAGDEPVAVRFRNELEGLGPDEGWQGWAWPVAPSGITWDLPAGDGPKTVAMELKDRAGNWGPPFRQSVILDTVAPESPAMARVVGGPSRAMVEWLAPRDPGEAEHTASGVAGYSVRYRRAGETEWSLLASKQVDGAARRATLTGLKDNERVDFEVQAQDRAGNLSAWSGTATGYSLPAAGVIAEYRSGYGETAGHYVEFFVAPVAADRCRIEVTHDAGGGSGSDWFPAPAAGYDPGAEGSQPQFRDEGLVSHGEYRYRLVTANPAGEETYGPERTITVANLPPEAPTLLYPKGWVSSATAELSILGPSVDRDGDPLTYTYSVWDAQGNPILADATSPTVSGLQDGGAYTWQVKVSDGYGGAAGSDMATFQVDLAPPQITLGNVSNEWAAEQQIVVSATDGRSGLTSLEYAWGDGPLTEMAPGQAILAPHGIQTLHVRATDAAGNVSEISHVYFVDSTPPEVSIPEVEGKPLIIQPDGPQYRLGVTSGDGLFARWRVADPESGVGAYRVGLVDDAVVQEAWKQEGGDGSLPIDPATLETVTEIHSDGVYQRAVPGQLQDGHAYRVVVQAQSRVGRWSTYVLSEPVFADSSPPELVPPTVTGATDWGGNLYTADFANLQVQMEARDPHSGVASLSYALICQPSLKGDETWANNVGDLNSQAASLPDGASCYIAVRAVNYAGLQAVAFTPAIIVDRTSPSIEKLVARGVAHPSKGFVTATLEAHDAQSGLRTCRFALGTTAGGHDLTDGAPGAQGGWLQRMYPSSLADLQIAGLPLPAGDVYLTVAVTNGAGREATSTVKVNLAAAEPAPVVVDDGAFTPSTREFHAWWTFVPAQAHTVQSYRYRLLDSAGHLVFDWKSLDAQAAGNPVEILERGTDPAQGLGLAQGRTYILQVQVIYSDGSPSPVGESDGIIVDATPPEGLAVEDGVYAPAGRLALRWQAADDASGIASYSFAVGTRPGLTDVTGGWRNVGPATEVVCTSLPLREGAVYYASVMATNGAGLESIAQSDGVRIDSTPPPAPKVQDGGLFTPDPTRLTASWLWTQDDPESGTVTFDYAILSSREIPLDVTWIPAGSARRLEARGLSLEDGATYYVAVRATNGAGLTSVGVSDGIGVDTTAPEVPRIDDGSDYQTDASSLSATFSAIDPQSGVRGYLYSAGTQAEPGSVARDVPFDPQGGASTARLAGLSLQSGQIYFFTVQAINQAGLVSNGGTSDGVMIDTGFPEVTDVQDEGSYTQNPAQLIASWSARPAASPIVEYQYAVVEDPFTGSPPWRSNGRLTYVLAKDLNLQDGKTYYVLVRAKSAAGAWTPQDHLGKSDGILVDSTPPPPPQVRVEARYTAGNLHFAWSGEDPESEIACWRYAVGSSRGGTDLTGGWVEVPGNVQEQTLTGLPVADGVAYYVTVLGQNKAGAWSEKGFSAAVFGDLTPPERPKITLRGSYTRSRQQIPSVQWQSADPQVGLASWRFAVVLAPASPGSPGAGEPPSEPAPSAVPPESAFSPPIPIRANSWQGDLTGLDLTEGAAYFVAIQTQNALGLWSEVGWAGPVTVDTAAPTLVFALGGTEIVTNGGQVEVSWSVDEAAWVDGVLVAPDGSQSAVHLQAAAGSHVWVAAVPSRGRYVLSLQPTDAAGNTGAAAVQNLRHNDPPIAFVGLGRTVRKMEPVLLHGTASDSDGRIARYTWDFGDGTPILAKESSAGTDNVEHRYAQVGTYTVTLRVTDNDGGVGETQMVIEVTNTHAGTLFTDETWSGEHALTGPVVVPPGLTLTVLPGTHVAADPTASLKVRGCLEVQGEPEAPTIWSASQAAPWQGILLENTQEANRLEHSVVQGAVRGVAVVAATCVLSSVTLQQNEIGLHVYAASPLVSGCIVQRNRYYGIKEDAGAQPQVQNCRFGGNGLADAGAGAGASGVPAGDYYDEEETLISIARLNELPGNSGNQEIHP